MDAARRFLESYLERTRARIGEVLSSNVELLSTTNSMLLGRPGKMLRPSLSLFCAAISGGITDESIEVAASSELIHNATLLHDDVVDGAAERRGLPTVMSMMGPQAAVLLGDFWLVRALRCLLSTGKAALGHLEKFAGTLSLLAEGELLQMQKADSLDTTEQDYLRIIYCKTASLFETSALTGAISGGADKETAEALALCGKNLGLAFQIRDDILDYEGSGLGKPTRIDLRERKITMPLLCVLAEADPEIRLDLRQKISEGSVDEVYDYVLAHRGTDLAREKINYYISEALDALAPFAPSEAKDYLIDLIKLK